jgi:hypothetical protein
MPIAAPYVAGALELAEAVPDSKRPVHRDADATLGQSSTTSVLDAGVAITRITGDRGHLGRLADAVVIGWRR